MTEKSFRIHDATLYISWPTEERGVVSKDSWNCAAAIERALRGIGFAIGRDDDVYKRHPSISKFHRYGKWDDLELKIEISPIGLSLTFWGPVFENRNGGQYDFDRLARMPYKVGLQFRHAVRSVARILEKRGFVAQRQLTSPVGDPLTYFNEHWDGDWERRNGKHRFKRDATGWPVDQELGAYGITDREGVRLKSGDKRYFRTRSGRLMRANVYGGINGRWYVLYGPGQTDWTCLSSSDLFTPRPDEPRKISLRRDTALQAALKSALAKNDFARAAKLCRVLDIDQRAAAPRKAA